jgi:dTMP kinase
MRTAEPEILLFLAARAELVNYVIEPNLKAGVSVLADRFADSTRAYQGGGWYRSNPKAINFINTTHNFIIRNHWPDKTFLLKIPYEVSKKRLYEMSSGKDDFEKRERKFIEAIIKEYDNIAKENPQRVVVIDATKSKEEVFNQILQHVNLLYGFKK